MQLKHKDTREGILKIFRLRDFSQIAKIAKLSENIRYRCISMTCVKCISMTRQPPMQAFQGSSSLECVIHWIEIYQDEQLGPAEKMKLGKYELGYKKM